MPLLRNCCCCCSLQQGTITLASLSLIGSLFGVASQALGLVYRDSVSDTFMKFYSFLLDDLSQVSGRPQLNVEERNLALIEAREYIVSVSFYVYVVCLVVMAASALVSILALVASVRKLRFLLVPWLLVQAITILGGLSVTIFVIFSIGFVQAFGFVIIVSIFMVVSLYCWVVIYSFYQELRSRDRAERDVPGELKTRLTAAY